MEDALKDKTELDSKIEKLIENFATKHKYGYKGEVSVDLVKVYIEGNSNNECIVTGVLTRVESVITT